MNAGRILVNTPASQGALGGTYNRLRPSLMLACGTSGKNTTTDNISAKHLLNIHRIARRQVCPCIEQDFIKHYLDESLDDVDIEKACRASQLVKQAALGGLAGSPTPGGAS